MYIHTGTTIRLWLTNCYTLITNTQPTTKLGFFWLDFKNYIVLFCDIIPDRGCLELL